MYATRVLCEVANERGVPTADVLAGTAIEPADLDDPDAVVGALDEITAVRRRAPWWARCLALRKPLRP